MVQQLRWSDRAGPGGTGMSICCDEHIGFSPTAIMQLAVEAFDLVPDDSDIPF